jgi:hypothetical protein
LNSPARIRFLALAVIGLLGAAVLLGRRSEEPPRRVAVPCADIVSGCGLPEHGLKVRFDQQPSPMRKFIVLVELPDARDLHARFAMRGMEMGLNRYRLLSDGKGRWKAEVMLPVCVQGRGDWLMLLETAGERYEVPFHSIAK